MSSSSVTNTSNDFIGVFKNKLDTSNCTNIIKAFELASDAGFTFNRQESSESRKKDKDDAAAHSYDLSDSFVPRYLALAIREAIWTSYDEYAEKYAVALTDSSAPHTVYGYKVQRTNIGQGYHTWHYESAEISAGRCLLFFIIYLNDVDDGGETEFLYQSRRIKPEAGTVLIAPAAFTHTHRGNPPLSNSKYIVTGWFEF